MITGKQTNFVYLSRLIASIEHYSAFWKDLKKILDQESIEFALLDNTEDIWIRSYMPFQINEKEFVQFSFFPEQATIENHEPAQSNPLKILNSLGLKNVVQTELIINGRDLIASDKKIIVSEKALAANSYIKDKKKFETILAELLGLTEVIIVPTPKKGTFWHIDSLLRMMNDNTLLVADVEKVKKHGIKELLKNLHETGKLLMNFPNAMSSENENEFTKSTFGCYINFIQIGNIIIFPKYNLPEDDIALVEVKKLYPYCKFIQIDCTTIAKEGAGLNSIIWNIKK